MPRYIIIALFKINDKEEILKAARHKRHKGKKDRGSLLKAAKEDSQETYLEKWKKKTVNWEFQIPFRNKGRGKKHVVTDTQGKIIYHKHICCTKILKDILNHKENGTRRMLGFGDFGSSWMVKALAEPAWGPEFEFLAPTLIRGGCGRFL